MRVLLCSTVSLIFFVICCQQVSAYTNCYRCVNGEAFRKENGTKINLEGCESPDIKRNSKQCNVICKQQILRKPLSQKVMSEGIQREITVTRHAGDIVLRGCSNSSTLGGQCKIINETVYECYCTQNFCNGMPPPCSWIRKANPAEVRPVGCIEDEESTSNNNNKGIVETEGSNTPSSPAQPAKAEATGSKLSLDDDDIILALQETKELLKEMIQDLANIKADLAFIRTLKEGNKPKNGK